MAFAIVETGQPGMWRAVKLRNVVAESVEDLVPTGSHTTSSAMAMVRASRAMEVWRNQRRRGRE